MASSEPVSYTHLDVYKRQDREVADFREAAKTFMKETKNWHFKISWCRRILIKRKETGRIVVRGEMTYNCDQGVYKSLMKPNKKPMELHPDVIPEKNVISNEKKRDVHNLLVKHYGEDWRNIEILNFFKHVVDDAEEVAMETHDVCACEAEEVDNLLI